MFGKNIYTRELDYQGNMTLAESFPHNQLFLGFAAKKTIWG